MAGKFERMKNHIQNIEKCDFECEARNLRGCQDWIELKKEIEELGAMEKIEPCCVDTRPKNHIERMEDEVDELQVKIKKLGLFLEKEEEEPKFTDEYQRQLLADQKLHMIRYSAVLLERIRIDKKKMREAEK